MSSRQRRSISTAEDRISALPDTLICHILSYLPTKLAAATSILFKRWTPLWLSVSTLDFDDVYFDDFADFPHFVFSVILSRDAALPLRSFRIRCGHSDNFEPCDLNLFVLAALKQPGLEVFNLSGDLHSIKERVPSVFKILSCKTLVVLKLKNLTIYEIPHLVDLPLLKTLHLNTINFEGNLVHFMNLVCGCPILEDLETNFIELPDHLEAEFKGFPNLVKANIYNVDETFPLVWLQNAKFLRAELTWINYDAYQIPTFHNLTHIELMFCSDSLFYPLRGRWKWTKQVLQHCPKLQSLIIDEEFDYSDGNVPEIEAEDWNDPKTVPECLSSHLRACSLRGYKGKQTEFQFAEYIMQNSKLLSTMTIKCYCRLDRNAKQKLVKLSSYPTVTCKLLFK